MHRYGMRVLLLVGLAVGFGSSLDVGAQSNKKRGGTVCDLGGMKSQVFDFWKDQKAASPNIYQFLLPKDLKTEQDAAILSIYPVTGAAADVISGWKGQITPPKGFKIDDVARTETFKVGNANVTRLYVQGDYTDGGKKMPDSRLLAFVFDEGDKKFAIRLVGPFKTVGIHVPDVDTFVKTFK